MEHPTHDRHMHDTCTVAHDDSVTVVWLKRTPEKGSIAFHFSIRRVCVLCVWCVWFVWDTYMERSYVCALSGQLEGGS